MAVARKGCVATGVPDSTVDPTLAHVFTQIRENVDRYNLLLKEYPFQYQREEEEVLRGSDGGDNVEYVDTVAYEAREHLRYRVGGIIFRDSVVHQDSVFQDPLPGTDVRRFVGMRTTGVERRRLMDLPTFADLVDPAFLAAHCFEYDGTTGRKGSGRLIRVNFQPAKSIKSPDVRGSVYLDADSLVVRRAVFGMTNSKAAAPPIFGFTVTTTFREILPLVPIVDSVESVQPGGFGRSALGADRLIGFAFEGATLGDQPSMPPQRDDGRECTATRHRDREPRGNPSRDAQCDAPPRRFPRGLILQTERRPSIRSR